MREIKFRAWGGEKEKYFVYFSLTNEDCFQYPESFIDDEPSGDGGYLTLDRIDVDDIQQYTGLKDKNGKEIYEGELMLTDDMYHDYEDGVAINALPDGKICPVEYRDAAFWCNGELLLEYASAWESIGNIYENPELLKANP